MLLLSNQHKEIWLIQAGELSQYLYQGKKMRTVLLAHQLAETGADVLWWTSAFDHYGKQWLTPGDDQLNLLDQLTVRTLRGLGYKRNVSLRRYADHLLVGMKFARFAQQMEKPDCIVASLPTLDLAYHACNYSKQNKIPFIVDVRDPWPDALLDILPAQLKRIGRVLLSRDYWMTRNILAQADSLVAVSETFLNWALSYAGRKRANTDRVFYIGHETAPAHLTNTPARFANLKEILHGKFVVTFVGTVSKKYHNPMVLVEAAKRLAKYKDIFFVIAGDGEFLEVVSKAAVRLGNIHLTGWLDQTEIVYLLKNSHIGTCPAAEPTTLMTNKFFSYLSEGLPVISAFGGDLEKIIGEKKVGLNYPPGNADAFASAILKLYSDKSLYKELSMNCRALFVEQFDSRKIYKEYCSHIETIMMAYPSRTKVSALP